MKKKKKKMMKIKNKKIMNKMMKKIINEFNLFYFIWAKKWSREN